MLKTVARLATFSAAAAILGAGAVLAQEVAPAAPAEGAAPAEPPPVLPTTGDGAQVIKVLNEVCKPLIDRRGQFEQLATTAGLTKDRRSNDNEFVLKLDPRRPYQIAVRPPSTANPNVCELRVRYAPGWQGPIIEALNVWRFLHEPQMRLQRNEAYDDPTARAQRTVNTWDNFENQGFDGAVWGLVITQLRNPDGSPTNPQYGEALIQYAKRPAQQQYIDQAKAYQEAMRVQAAQEAQAAQQQQTAPATDPAA